LREATPLKEASERNRGGRAEEEKARKKRRRARTSENKVPR
jgi:hypothetical protein